jgi:alcohol dehydrogenase class IV
MPHGLACACTLVPYFKTFKDRNVVNMILEWCRFKSLDDMEDYMKKVIGPDLAKYSATDEEIEAWADDMAKQPGRFAVHPEPAGRAEIVQMYKWAFGK